MARSGIEFSEVQAIHAADIDGDGSMDFIAAGK